MIQDVTNDKEKIMFHRIGLPQGFGDVPSNPPTTKSQILHGFLVGGFNPFEKYSSKLESSPNRDETKKYLKPPRFCTFLSIQSKVFSSNLRGFPDPKKNTTPPLRAVSFIQVLRLLEL